MKVFTVMFHTSSNDMIVNIFSSEVAAKKCAEDCAAKFYPTRNYHWYGHCLFCGGQFEEWSVQDWTVKE